MLSPSTLSQPQRVALMLESEGPGGAEVVVVQLAEELRRQGHDVCPVILTRATSPGWLERSCRAGGFDPEVVAIRGALDLRTLRRVISVLRTRHITAVHSHEFGMAVYGAAAARWLRLPHVVTMHGNMWMTQAWRRRAALRWVIRNSAAFVAVSHDTARHLARDLMLPQTRIGTVWNGIPERHGDRTALRSALSMGEDDALLVAVGNLIERKGHAVLIRALGRIHRLEPSLRWRLAIAGEGVERPTLERLCSDLGLGDRVVLLGHRSDIPSVMAAADIFVMPSLWEGLPLAVLEAMFAGAAVVASDVSGIPEAIPTPDVGRLVPPGDTDSLAAALEPLVRDAALRRRLGAAAQARARETFTVARMASDYLALYAAPAGAR